VKSNTYSTPLSGSIIYLLAPPKLQNTHKARWELMVASFLNDVALLDYSTMEKTTQYALILSFVVVVMSLNGRF
jgi:hypothetical protein